MADAKAEASTTGGLQRPWHGDFAGNGTDALVILAGLLLTFCTLSGKWCARVVCGAARQGRLTHGLVHRWLVGDVSFGIVFAAVVTVLMIYLEYRAQV